MERTRELHETVTHELHYDIAGLAQPARALAAIIRNHWYIENGLYWPLDVVCAKTTRGWSMGHRTSRCCAGSR